MGHEPSRNTVFVVVDYDQALWLCQGVESVAPWQFAAPARPRTGTPPGRKSPCRSWAAMSRSVSWAPARTRSRCSWRRMRAARGTVEPAGYDELGAVDVAVLLEQRARCGLETASLFMSKSRRSSSLRVTSISRWPSLPAPRLPEHGSPCAPRAAFPSDRLSWDRFRRTRTKPLRRGRGRGFHGAAP